MNGAAAAGSGSWWSSSGTDSTNAWYVALSYDSGEIFDFSFSKFNGFSVRCLRD